MGFLIYFWMTWGFFNDCYKFKAKICNRRGLAQFWPSLCHATLFFSGESVTLRDTQRANCSQELEKARTYFSNCLKFVERTYLWQYENSSSAKSKEKYISLFLLTVIWKSLYWLPCNMHVFLPFIMCISWLSAYCAKQLQDKKKGFETIYVSITITYCNLN